MDEPPDTPSTAPMTPSPLPSSRKKPPRPSQVAPSPAALLAREATLVSPRRGGRARTSVFTEEAGTAATHPTQSSLFTQNRCLHFEDKRLEQQFRSAYFRKYEMHLRMILFLEVLSMVTLAVRLFGQAKEPGGMPKIIFRWVCVVLIVLVGLPVYHRSYKDTWQPLILLWAYLWSFAFFVTAGIDIAHGTVDNLLTVRTGFVMAVGLVTSKVYLLTQLWWFFMVLAHEAFIMLIVGNEYRTHVMFPMLFVLGFWRAYAAEVDERRLFVLAETIKLEHEKLSHLLELMLPPTVVTRLLAHKVVADAFQDVTVLFAEVDNFIAMSEEFTPQQVVDSLNRVYSAIEELLVGTEIYQVESMGEQALLISGCPIPHADHAIVMARFALGLVATAVRFRWPDGRPIVLRIGIHSGSVMASVIGTKRPQYNIIGDSVNTAARVLSKCESACIRVSDSTRELLGDKFECVSQGYQDFKGKGIMETFNLVGEKQIIDPPFSIESSIEETPVVQIRSHCHTIAEVPVSIAHQASTHSLQDLPAPLLPSNAPSPEFRKALAAVTHNERSARERSRSPTALRRCTTTGNEASSSSSAGRGDRRRVAHMPSTPITTSATAAAAAGSRSSRDSLSRRRTTNSPPSPTASSRHSSGCDDVLIPMDNLGPQEPDEPAMLFQDDRTLYKSRTHLCFQSEELEEAFCAYAYRQYQAQQRTCFVMMAAMYLVSSPFVLVLESFRSMMVLGRTSKVFVALVLFAVSYWKRWHIISRPIMVIYGVWNTIYAVYEFVWLSGGHPPNFCDIPNTRWLGSLAVCLVFFELNGLPFYWSVLAAALITLSLVASAIFTCGPAQTLPIFESLWYLLCLFAFSLTSRFSFERKQREFYILTRRSEYGKMLMSDLVENILPPHASECLLGGRSLPVRSYDGVTLLFSDIVGFTGLSAMLSPLEMRTILHTLYQCFDDLCEELGVYKVATVGDAYIAAAGCPDECEDHAQRILDLAFGMQAAIKKVHHTKVSQIQMRIGIHTGSVYAGITGTRTPHFHLFGPSCHIAHTLESLAPPSGILVSETTTGLLAPTAYLLHPTLTPVSIDGTSLHASVLLPPHSPFGTTAAAAAAANIITMTTTTTTTTTTVVANVDDDDDDDDDGGGGGGGPKTLAPTKAATTTTTTAAAAHKGTLAPTKAATTTTTTPTPTNAGSDSEHARARTLHLDTGGEHSPPAHHGRASHSSKGTHSSSSSSSNGSSPPVHRRASHSTHSTSSSSPSTRSSGRSCHSNVPSATPLTPLDVACRSLAELRLDANDRPHVSPPRARLASGSQRTLDRVLFVSSRVCDVVGDEFTPVGLPGS